MKTLSWTHLFLSAIVVFVLSACGGGSSKDTSLHDIAIEKIVAYATDGQVAPTAQDYIDAGVTRVTPENVEKVNEVIVEKTAEEVDTTSEIQAIVDTVVPIVITHNGVNYGIVVSPITGRTWLDKNIGASQKCNTPYDRGCFGDYYQWGRNTDGHEKPNSKTTTTKGKTITDSGDKFVINHNDWTTDVHRGANWRATDGRSVCPIGFRVPTVEEFQADTSDIIDKKTQLENFLKLPYAGYRFGYDGDLNYKGEEVYYWTNEPEADSEYANAIVAYSGREFFHDIFRRTSGMSIRCIKQ